MRKDKEGAAPAVPAVPIKGAYLNNQGGITLCQPGKEREGFGFVSMLAPALQVIDAPRVEDDEKRIMAGARALSTRVAKECDVTEADMWKRNSSEFRADAAAVLAAVDALPIARQAQPTDELRKAVREMARMLGDSEWAEQLICDPDAIELQGEIARLVCMYNELRAKAQPTEHDAVLSKAEEIARCYDQGTPEGHAIADAIGALKSGGNNTEGAA
jgi:hypothetical protein